jgi:hypothetical protein
VRSNDLIGGLVSVAAVLFVACGGGLSEAVPAAEPATIAARADGLTGAPVAVTPERAGAFDADRLSPLSQTFPPLDDPRVVPASEASWLQPDTLVLGAVQGGEARAYPLFIMQFHHVANDTLGGKP